MSSSDWPCFSTTDEPAGTRIGDGHSNTASSAVLTPKFTDATVVEERLVAAPDSWMAPIAPYADCALVDCLLDGREWLQ